MITDVELNNLFLNSIKDNNISIQDSFDLMMNKNLSSEQRSKLCRLLNKFSYKKAYDKLSDIQKEQKDKYKKDKKKTWANKSKFCKSCNKLIRNGNSKHIYSKIHIFNSKNINLKL